MRREIQIEIELGGACIAVVEEEKGGYWEASEVQVPPFEEVICNGIWKDDSVFLMKNKYSGDILLRLETETLIKMIATVANIVRDNEGWWTHTDTELRTRLADALGLSLKDPLAELIVETPPQAPKRGRGRPRLTDEEKAKAKKARYMKEYYQRRNQKEEGVAVPITRL